MKDLTVVDQYLMIKSLWREVCDKYDIQNNRHRRNVVYRHAFSVACVEQTKLTLKRIGSIIGKDHTSVLHATKQHEANYLYDTEYKEVYASLSREIEIIVDQCQDIVTDNLAKRIISSNLDESIGTVVGGYKKKIQRMKDRHEREVAELNERLERLGNQFKIINDRNNKLHSELIRVKNLV